MLRVTRIRCWTPKYFSASRAARTPRTAPHSGDAAAASQARAGAKEPRTASRTRHGTPRPAPPRVLLSSATLLAEHEGERTAALAATVKQAPEALWRLEQQSRAGSSEDVLATSFAVKRDLLGPLALMLPAAPVTLRERRAATTAESELPPRRPRLRIVPDGEALSTPPASPTPVHQHEEQKSSTTGAVLSLEDAVLVLMLYSAVESEDGALLQQVLAQVDRFLTENVQPLRLQGNSAAEAGTVKLPLPALLLALSQVGVVVEHTLEQIIRRPSMRREKSGVLYAQLAHYDINELLQVLAGLHRFGFHQHYAFECTIKELQVRWRRPRSPDVLRVQKVIRQSQRRRSSDAHRAGSDLLVHTDESDAGPHPPQSQCDALRAFLADAGLPEALRVDETRLLVETLTALSLSVFRRSDAVACIADVLVLNALATLNGQPSRDDRHLLSQYLHRAVHLCETMELQQSLLAETFGLACSLGEKGILFDGGEDTDDVPTERRAYYDHVTADLVKVNHL